MNKFLVCLPNFSDLHNCLRASSNEQSEFEVCNSITEVCSRLKGMEQKQHDLYVLLEDSSSDLSALLDGDFGTPFSVVYLGDWQPILKAVGNNKTFMGLWGERSPEVGGVRDWNMLRAIVDVGSRKVLPDFFSFFKAESLLKGEKIVSNVSEKRDALQELEDFVLGLGDAEDASRLSQYARKAGEAVDELLLNAIWDANPTLQQAHRGDDFVLPPSEQVRVRWGFDGDRFGYSVSDPFGTLEKESIIRHLLGGEVELGAFAERKSGGLGMKRVFERSHHVVAAVRKGALTELQCFFRFERRLRDFQAVPKSLHYFIEGGAH